MTLARPEMEFSGTILRGPPFEPVEGRLLVESGVLKAIEETAVESDDIVLPSFVNAHTHVGDSIAKEAGRGLTLEGLVAPPDGLKHRLLEEASVEEQVGAMRRSLAFMEASGTGAFIDFREGGPSGVEALRKAASGMDLEPVIMGRGDPAVLEVADGYGASGAADREFDAERAAARTAGKPFGIHAGEGDPGDIAAALELHPDHLVHMVHADAGHLERVEEAGIPVVVCPRSNLATGVGLPDIETLLDHTTVALGTDNVMLNSPSMFREMAMAATCCDLDAPTVLGMATKAGAEVAGLEGGVIEEGAPARIQVIDGETDNLVGYRDPIRTVVRRAGVADVKHVHLPPDG